MTIRLRQLEAPSVALISTTDAKAHLRVDHSEDDDLIAGLVSSATGYLDADGGILGRALISQKWRMSFTSAPTSRIVPIILPRLITVDYIRYIDGDGNSQVFDSGKYEASIYGDDAFVELLSGNSWPSTGDREVVFCIDFTAGYGATAADIPKAIRQAALMLVALWYEMRMAADVSPTSPVAFSVDRLTMPHRVARTFF